MSLSYFSSDSSYSSYSSSIYGDVDGGGEVEVDGDGDGDGDGDTVDKDEVERGDHDDDVCDTADTSNESGENGERGGENVSGDDGRDKCVGGCGGRSDGIKDKDAPDCEVESSFSLLFNFFFDFLGFRDV